MLFMFLLLWLEDSEILPVSHNEKDFKQTSLQIYMTAGILCEWVNLSYFPHRSEWCIRHYGPLWARAEARSWIYLHHAQSHEWSRELPVLLTNTHTEEVQPGQTEQVRKKDTKQTWIYLDLATIKPVTSVIYFEYKVFHPLFSFLFQSAYVRFAPRDQWHNRACWIFHKALRAPHLAVHKGFALPAAQSWPHWDCHRPHGIRQALLPSHLQLHQTGVQKPFGNVLTSPSDQKNIHPSLIFTDCAIHFTDCAIRVFCLQYLLWYLIWIIFNLEFKLTL